MGKKNEHKKKDTCSCLIFHNLKKQGREFKVDQLNIMDLGGKNEKKIPRRSPTLWSWAVVQYWMKFT